MKKIIFVFIMAFATITLMAQQTDEFTEVLDSLVITDIDGDFVRAKFNYGYDDQGRLNQVIFSKVEEYSTDLHYSEKWHYDYDDNDRCLSFSYWNWENDNWFLHQKTDSVFDNVGNCVFVSEFRCAEIGAGHSYNLWEYDYENNKCVEYRAYSHSESDTIWVPYERLRWEYDELGNLTQEFRDFTEGNDWKPYSKMVYTYNGPHQLVFEEYFLWNANTGAWDSEGTTTEYEYNADGFLLREYYISSNNIEKETKYIYDERNNPIWYYFCQTTLPDFIWEQDTIEFAYNENDSLVWKLENFTHHNGAIDHPVLYEYERDGQDRVIVESCFDNFSNGQLPRFRNETVYDEQGRVVVKHHLGYSMDNGALLSNSYVEYEFDNHGNLVAELERIQDELGTGTYFFNQAFDYNTSAANILGENRAWNDFIDFMTDHETSWITDGQHYYWMTDHFPINDKWVSGRWRFIDPDTWFNVNVDVALYYSAYHESLPETPATNNARVHNIEGGLAVESDAPVDIVVYDMLGRAVAHKRQALHSEFHLTSGVYVVKVNDKAVKAVVK